MLISRRNKVTVHKVECCRSSSKSNPGLIYHQAQKKLFGLPSTARAYFLTRAKTFFPYFF